MEQQTSVHVMDFATRAIRLLVINSIAAAAVCVGMVTTIDSSVAQGVAAPEPAKKVATKKTKSSKDKAPTAAAKKDPAEAQKALDAGIRAFQAGKFDVALQQLDKAMSDGGLPANQVARALYYRGIVHRKQGKPALAISDLTNALWLKGGLSEQERADATSHRAQSYREAGLTEPPAAETGAATGREPKTTTGAREPSRSTSVATATETTTESSSSGIAGFFSNLLSGSSSSAPPPATLTSDGSPEAAPKRESATGAPSSARSAGSSWSSTTQVPPAPPERPERKIVAKAPALARPPVPATMTTGSLAASSVPGGIRINVATLRSRQEAQAIVDRIKREHGGSLLRRELTIDEATAASGAVYNVRIGRFANAEESRELCAQLRKTGLECMILAR